MTNKEKEFEIIEEDDSYTIVNNNILRNKNISNGAIGLLGKMTSLPPEWDYSFNGLVAICKDGKFVIRNQLNELKEAGYVKISQTRNEKGHFKYKYTVYKKPHLERELNGNLPTPNFPTTVSPASVKQQQINTYITNNKIIKDKLDKYDKTNFKHNFLTEELINLNFIKENESSSFYFDGLFTEYLEAGYTPRELLDAIHYIVPRVISRNYIDEEGNEIKNKYGYFKNAIESNFNKLNNLGKELYPDDPNDKFWDDFEL